MIGLIRRRRAAWTSLILFDARCDMGRFRHFDAPFLHSRENLLAEMDYFGIAEAPVRDSLSGG